VAITLKSKNGVMRNRRKFMTDIETTRAEIQEVFPEVLADYAEVMGVSKEVIAQYTDIECVNGERDFWPYPTLRENKGRDITVVCNLHGKQSGWDQVFDEGLALESRESQRLYVAAGLASVGLVHIAYDAKVSRSESARIGLKRVKRIMEQLEDKEVLDHQIMELEVAERIESSLYPIEIDYPDIKTINRIRFSLGVAYLVTDFDMELRDKASAVFTDLFSEDLKRLGDDLISFAYGFGLDKHVDPEVYKQKGVSRALHLFNFAGIFPMDMSDIMRT
jgi:hypothetical protein